jgi:hypothetical protein
MLLRSLFGAARPRTTAPRPRVQLVLDALDDRIVPASLSVGDAAIVEGNDGAQYAIVSANLDEPSRKTVTVNYTTADGSAQSDSDYGTVSGRLTFARGETSKTIAVPVYGDRLDETEESFTIRLSRAKGASIADGTGVVTIVDDDGTAQVGVGDAAGTVVYRVDGTVAGATLQFTVSLSAPQSQPVTVNYATADGTATAGVDYLAASGTLTFAPGETTKTITVEAVGNDSGLDEWFSLNLSEPSGNAQIINGQGVGTIHFYVEQPGDCGCECTPDSPYYPNC